MLLLLNRGDGAARRRRAPGFRADESSVRPGARGGMTIVELLFAVALLVVALAAAYTMIVQCKRMLLAARDHYVATTLCLARVERARDIAYPLLSLLDEPAPGIVLDQDGVPDENGHFRRTTTVLVDTPAESVTRLNVTVAIRHRKTGLFNDRDKEEMSCVYTTYLTAQDIR